MIGLMDAANYAYAYGWVSALPQSLGKETYEKLITSRGIDELVATLAGTAYSKEILEGIKKGATDKETLVDVAAIEKEITAHYVNICKAVISALPMGVRDGARAIMMDEWDVMNLKRIIRGVSKGKRGEDIISVPPEILMKQN
jgi:vacuolar-type H+-ATPase subunit C/Vma6